MIHPNFRLIRAIGTMVGTIVGAGVFGLPYVFAQSGAGIGAAWLLGLGAVMAVLFLMYAEVVIQTPGVHRLGGYVNLYLGPRWKDAVGVLLTFTFGGAMLAYVVIGSQFLHAFFSPILPAPEWAYAVALTVGVAVMTWRGNKFTSRTEGVVVGVLLFLFTFAILAALPSVSLANLAVIHWNAGLLPYGVILFSLSGLGAVPEMKDILGQSQKHRLPYAVVCGFFLILALYLAFSLTIVGVTGSATTSSALIGLSAALGGSFGAVSAFLGSLTLFSVFSMTSLQLQNALRFDVKMPHGLTWALVSFVPIVLYFIGFRQFIGIIGFVGAVFSGSLSVIVVAVYERMRHSPVCREHRCLNIPSLLSVIVAVLFMVGVIAEIISFFA